METADLHLKSGDLDGARAALIATVKKSPADQAARLFLFQLLAVMGDWDKASSQLRALASLSAEAQMLATVYDQAMTAERKRLDAWSGRQPFDVLVPSSPWVGELAQALGHFAAGRRAEGEQLRDQAFDQAGDTPGQLGDDERFSWISDVDPRLGPCFEAIVSGRWGLVPFEAVETIKSEGPRDLRDVIWYPVEMRLRSGQSAAALLPARYAGSELSDDSAVRLGRATAWVEDASGERPVGQRLWTTNAGEDLGLLSLRRLDFA